MVFEKQMKFYLNIFNIIISGTINFHPLAKISAFIEFVQNQHHFLLIMAEEYLFDIICGWNRVDLRRSLDS